MLLAVGTLCLMAGCSSKVSSSKGIVSDATMNTVTIVTDKNDTLSFSTMDANKEEVNGLLLNDTLEVFYTGKYTPGMPATKLVQYPQSPLVGFLLMIPMFNKAAELCVPYFNALLGNVIPNNTLIISIAFAVLAPLGLFRGPFTLFGCGAATLGILKGIGFSIFSSGFPSERSSPDEISVSPLSEFPDSVCC